VGYGNPAIAPGDVVAVNQMYPDVTSPTTIATTVTSTAIVNTNRSAVNPVSDLGMDRPVSDAFAIFRQSGNAQRVQAVDNRVGGLIR
jgi:hypothetical protein